MNLDTIDYPDYSFGRQYYLFNHELINSKEEILEKIHFGYKQAFEENNYVILTSRGCPHMCTYCYKPLVAEIYKTKRMRFMNVDRIMEELNWMKKNLPFYRRVAFVDDDFFARKPDQIKEFAARYKKEIGFDFFCCGNPELITEEKLDVLVDAGLTKLQVGIQSGSDRLNKEIYNRPIYAKDILRAAAIVNKKIKESRLRVYYDFIINNPYENDEDIKKSISLALSIPRPYTANIFSLTFSPGTPLYARALSDKLISENSRLYNKSYGKYDTPFKVRYLTLVLVAYLNQIASRRIVNLLASSPIKIFGDVLLKLISLDAFKKIFVNPFKTFKVHRT